MNPNKHQLLFALLMMAGAFTLNAQVYTNKPEVRVDKQTKDSLKATIDYPYSLPILGEKAAKAGYQLPYSAGVGLNYLWTDAELVIENLSIGFNHGPLYNLNEIVRFDKSSSTVQALNFRPDIWLFPFLNVYGVIAKGTPSTEVNFGVYVPDADGNWTRAATFNTKADFQATTYGFGLTPTIGVKGGWIALDMNFTWNDIAQLSKPAFAYVFGPRFGKTFKFKKADSNVAFWVGGFRLALNTGTAGSLDLTELMDTNGLQEKVTAGLETVDQKQANVDTWWTGLTPLEQAKPSNVAKHESANRAIARAGEFLGSLDAALNDEQHASVQYSLDKRPKNMWNFLVGTQYQISKSWMLRGEFGFLASRTQFIGGLQYRFPL
jgi:hypothetical protein